MIVLFVATGCGDESGGGEGQNASSPATALATEPVDLAPGQTQAQLAWTPSEGTVSSYMVFASRNVQSFAFAAQTNEPMIQIEGAPGDSVRLIVVAVGENGSLSESSPPSVPIRFHAALAPDPVEALTHVESSPSYAATPIDETTDAPHRPVGESASVADGDALAATDSAESLAPPAEVPTDETRPALARALREQLLRSNVRLPYDGLSSQASLWIQSFVDHEIAAGVSLAGTGRADEDGLRELVWQDHAGQLFVSDGRRFATSDDLPATFREAIRLRPTERFAGLDDFDGDGVGDWMIEDTATGEAWIIDGATHEAISAHSDRTANETAGLELLGHGDFDGNGRAELLWRNEDQSLFVSHPGGEASSIEAAPQTTDRAPSEFLAIADLNGDGRDDVLSRTTNGRLLLALCVTKSSPASDGEADESAANDIQTLWVSGADVSSEALELLATIDLDRDGAAEIAWLNGDALEIWDPREGPETPFGL